MHEIYFGRGDEISRSSDFPASEGTVAELDGKLRPPLWGRAGRATCHSWWPSPACSLQPVQCPPVLPPWPRHQHLRWQSSSDGLVTQRQVWMLWKLKPQNCAEMAQGPELFSPKLKSREIWQPSQWLRTSVRERIWESCPKKKSVSSFPELTGTSHRWDESNFTLTYSISTPEDRGSFSRCMTSALLCKELTSEHHQHWQSHQGCGVLVAGGGHRGQHKASSGPEGFG